MKSIPNKVGVGAIIVIGVGLAFLLKSLGLNVGTELNSNRSAAPADLLDNMEIVADLSPSPAPQKIDSKSTENISLPDTTQMVTLIVEEKHFLLGSNSTPPKIVKPIKLEDALKIVNQTKGNEQGIRCRIFYLGSSLPSAETQLSTQLKELGLTHTDISIEERVLEIN